MPRRARVEFEGAVYHVLDRGDRREAIFQDDTDRQMFLATLGQACTRTGWQVHAYVLMGNHYHLLLQTPEANLVKGMHWFQCTYTVRFNRRHHLAGHLFQGRYRAVVVDPEQRHYFLTLSDYIHLNPVRGRMLGGGQLSDYRWSSYPTYAEPVVERPEWLRLDAVLGELGLEDRAGDRRIYAERMQQRAVEDKPEKAGCVEELKRGWCLGGVDFRKKMLVLLDAASDRIRQSRTIDARISREHGEVQAEQMLHRALQALELPRENLARIRKNDPRKTAIGVWIKTATVVSNEWIADRLKMGHASRVSRYCRDAPDAAPQLAEMLAVLNRMAKSTT